MGIGTGKQGQRLLPNFWGAGAVLPHKFVTVTMTDGELASRPIYRWKSPPLVSSLYQINKTCRLLQHHCCVSFIIAYLKPEMHNVSLKANETISSKRLYQMGSFSAGRCTCPPCTHSVKIWTQSPQQGTIMTPKILPKMANISVSEFRFIAAKLLWWMSAAQQLCIWMLLLLVFLLLVFTALLTFALDEFTLS